MSDDTNALAWELLAMLAYLTGRLYGRNPETAHELLVAWLAESDDHVDTAHEWLNIAHTRLPDTSPSREHQGSEFRLRMPIEEALGIRRTGQGGIVGVVRGRMPKPIRTWLNRHRFR